MSDFTTVMADAGTGTGALLNPLFGKSETTTTTTGNPNEPSPTSSNKTSTILIVVVVVVLLVAGAFLIFKNKS